jgi:hypothetical protein
METADSAAIPALSSILPDVKRTLVGEEAEFLLHEVLRSQVQEEGICSIQYLPEVSPGVFYIDDVLSPSTCHALRKAIDESPHLSFWSASGREDVNAKRFRNADTIELQSNALADALWRKIEPFVSHYSFDIPIEEDERGDLNWERELPGHWQVISLTLNLTPTS